MLSKTLLEDFLGEVRDVTDPSNPQKRREYCGAICDALQQDGVLSSLRDCPGYIAHAFVDYVTFKDGKVCERILQDGISDNPSAIWEQLKPTIRVHRDAVPLVGNFVNEKMFEELIVVMMFNYILIKNEKQEIAQ